jgi:hypothetical protein
MAPQQGRPLSTAKASTLGGDWSTEPHDQGLQRRAEIHGGDAPVPMTLRTSEALGTAGKQEGLTMMLATWPVGEGRTQGVPTTCAVKGRRRTERGMVTSAHH